MVDPIPDVTSAPTSSAAKCEHRHRFDSLNQEDERVCLACEVSTRDTVIANLREILKNTHAAELADGRKIVVSQSWLDTIRERDALKSEVERLEAIVHSHHRICSYKAENERLREAVKLAGARFGDMASRMEEEGSGSYESYADECVAGMNESRRALADSRSSDGKGAERDGREVAPRNHRGVYIPHEGQESSGTPEGSAETSAPKSEDSKSVLKERSK